MHVVFLHFMPMHGLVRYPGGQQPFQLLDGESLAIGRQPTGTNKIAIPEVKGLSRQHASIDSSEGAIYITDSSTNGTFVNGKRLEYGKRTQIEPGDMCYLGGQEVSLVVTEVPPYKSFEIVQNDPSRLRYGLRELLKSKHELIIGRGQQADFTVADTRVSRRHARVFKEGDAIFVEDLGSTNGTFLNQTRIKGKTLISESDILYIGLFAFSLNAGIRNLQTEPAIQASYLSKTYPGGKVALHNLHLTVNTGEFVALMGPSGCGKSTLLRALNGDDPGSTGEVFLFGLELNTNYPLLKHTIGYVPQDDIVHGELSVDETLYYAAKLRLADDADDADIASRISEVLSVLLIDDPGIRATRVDRLSGGQRKRVSIAVELLSNPAILFLDEPTSPLDPETVEEFLKCIKSLCAKGTTVVMVTHKPEDLFWADRLVFIGTSGYHVYDGSQDGFLAHFGKHKITEVYGMMNAAETARLHYQRWYKNAVNVAGVTGKAIAKRNETNPIRQLYWLVRRYAHIKVSNASNNLLLLVQPVLIASLILLVFGSLLESPKTGKPGVLFMMTTASIWFGVSNAAREIIGEKAIFRREALNNIRMLNYFLSKWFVLGIISFLQLLLFMGILRFSLGADFVAFGNSLALLWFVSLSAILFGLMLSAWSGSTEEVMTILPVALMPQILLGGVVAPLENKFSSFLSYFTFGRWGTEALGRVQDEGREGVFMDLLHRNLYTDDAQHWADELYSNLIMISVLDLMMLVGVFYGLNKLLKKR